MILDIIALVAVVTLPVLLVIRLDERRFDRAARQAVAIGNWRRPNGTR